MIGQLGRLGSLGALGHDPRKGVEAFTFTYNGVPYTFGGVRYEYRG